MLGYGSCWGFNSNMNRLLILFKFDFIMPSLGSEILQKIQQYQSTDIMLSEFVWFFNN